MSNLWSHHLWMWQPRSHSISPLSVMANLFLILEVVRSDSDLDDDANKRSSTLVAEMLSVEADFQTYTLQSNWQWWKPREE